MEQWKPGVSDQQVLRNVQCKMFTSFLSRASREEIQIVEPHGPWSVDINLSDVHVHLRFSLYESLTGYYLSGEKDQYLYPAPEDSSAFINALTQRERLNLANALTASQYPTQSTEVRQQQSDALRDLSKQIFPYAVEDGESNRSKAVSNEKIIDELREMHDRIMSTDTALFWSPEAKTEPHISTDAIMNIARVVLKQIKLLTDSEEDGLLTSWASSCQRAIFPPYFDIETVAVDFSMHQDVFQRFAHSVHSGHTVVTIDPENRAFQRLINRLYPEQRQALAKEIEKINVETLQEEDLAGSVSVSEAIQLRTELLHKIRNGSLNESE